MDWHGKRLTFVLENAIVTDFALVRAQGPGIVYRAVI